MNLKLYEQANNLFSQILHAKNVWYTRLTGGDSSHLPIWGDLSCDIQDEWNELMDEGVSPRKATKIILKSWQEEFSDYDDEED